MADTKSTLKSRDKAILKVGIALIIAIAGYLAGNTISTKTNVINKENEDNTSFFNKGAEIALKICLEQNITKALLKQKSPSCGSKQIYDGTFTNTLINGDGITSKLLRQNNITIYDENDIETLIELAKNK